MKHIIVFFGLLFAALGASGQIYIDSYRFGAGTPPAPLFLDDYPNAAVAYSLRLLRNGYTGSCVEVRRSSDDALLNIGFSGGVLDTVALKTFCAATNCFVRTWYDQSGNNNNAVAVANTSQAQIISSGSLIMQNTKPSIQFDGSNDFFATNSTLSLLTSHSLISVANNNNKSVAVLYGSTSPTSNFNSDNLRFSYNAGGVFSQVNGFEYGQRLIAVFRNNTTSVNIFQNQNNVPFALTISANNNFTIKEIGRRADLLSFLWLGTMQEIIIYSADRLTDRIAMRNNINAFYSIY